MSSLQKVSLGTPPTAVDGDTSRDAFSKANSNVDVLNKQAALTSAAATITTAQALTADHVGKRVNISLASAGTINVPPAATMGLDGIVHLRNIGSTLVTLAIASGSGDTLAVTKISAGESVIIDSDGSHAIGCLMRGRSTSDDAARKALGVGRTLLKSVTVSGAASLTFTDTDFGGYDSISLVFVGLQSSASYDFRFTMAPNADGSGNSGYSSAYHSLLQWSYMTSDGSGGQSYVNNRAIAYGKWFYTNAAAALANGNGEITFNNMLGLNSLGPQFFGRCFSYDGNSNFLNGSFGGFLQANVGAVKNITLYPASGTITGKVLVYGNNS
jgi:hypothetical protein